MAFPASSARIPVQFLANLLYNLCCCGMIENYFTHTYSAGYIMTLVHAYVHIINVIICCNVRLSDVFRGWRELYVDDGNSVISVWLVSLGGHHEFRLRKSRVEIGALRWNFRSGRPVHPLQVEIRTNVFWMLSEKMRVKMIIFFRDS